MKQKIKSFVHYSTNPWEKGRLTIYPCDICSVTNGQILVGEIDVEFDIPDDFDPRPSQIAALQAKQKEAAAAFYAMTTELDRQISKLQALEFTA